MPWSERVSKMLLEERFFIDEQHIVLERPWRGILVPHVHQVLRHGRLYSCDAHEAIWRGEDSEGRTLELALRPFSEDFDSLPTWEHAAWVCIKTAYIPDGKKNDEKRKKRFEETRTPKRARRKP
jgi:hypothetical protein